MGEATYRSRKCLSRDGLINRCLLYKVVGDSFSERAGEKTVFCAFRKLQNFHPLFFALHFIHWLFRSRRRSKQPAAVPRVEETDRSFGGRRVFSKIHPVAVPGSLVKCVAASQNFCGPSSDTLKLMLDRVTLLKKVCTHNKKVKP